MLFYRAEVEVLQEIALSEREDHNEFAAVLRANADAFFAKNKVSGHIAISNMMYRKKRAVLCIATHQSVVVAELVQKFIKAVDLNIGQMVLQEITLEHYCKMLQTASRYDFVDNDDDIYEILGIAKVYRSLRRGALDYSETVLDAAGTKKDLLRQAEGLLCGGSLTDEIERIYQGSQHAVASGHPVHYLLQSDDRDARNHILQILLTSLYHNNRLQSRRYTEINIGENKHFSESALAQLYTSCDGGTVVISFYDDNAEDSDNATPGADCIAAICRIMRYNRNKVLTVFCLQPKAEKVKRVFYDQLEALTIVPIRQEATFCDQAMVYLRSRAKSFGVPANKELYKALTPGTSYTASNLNTMFDEWYDQRLKTKVYTQYAALDTAKKQVAVRKPKGWAIDELEQMIGLDEAKKTIHQALDFYKAQKLFKAKGFKHQRPAMHMVFTGNPGTAKTTVARLFAQIMKDNNLLSVGDLHEVGRADLVGKYVGWTAAIVKEKFKAAKGSVLFIDEAYSLVEHRDGLYGDEAINTIVQEMENCREDMIVVFAGYPDKMEGFLQKNPGLRSRIAFHVPFSDYTSDEMVQITELMATQKNLKLSADIHSKLVPIYETAMKNSDFGNGRYVRNLFEKAIMKQASRLVSMDVDTVTVSDLERLLPEDFEAPAVAKEEMRRIGFLR